jgi:Concanavalin A-like lectin/glucanases superfamily
MSCNRDFLLCWVAVAQALAVLMALVLPASGQTVSLWLFDEPLGLYPSSVLDNSSENDFPLVIGRGGVLVDGKFGHALDPVERPPIEFPLGESEFGLGPGQPSSSATSPMTWRNATFAALMTRGESHLRKEIAFANATDGPLNVGGHDWTVEFWLRIVRPPGEEGVVWELGAGPRASNDEVTRLILDRDHRNFRLINRPTKTVLVVPSALSVGNELAGTWHHCAFVYDAEASQLRHYVDGVLQPLPPRCVLQAVPHGDEAYFTIGRDGQWEHPLPGPIDELRFSRGQVYRGSFTPPSSFAPARLHPSPKKIDRPLLWGPKSTDADPVNDRRPIPLGNRKHVFLDDALIAEMENCEFTVNPPRKAEQVFDNITGALRKHLTVVEDEEGLIRIYYGVEHDHLAVRVSRDGVNFAPPKLSPQLAGKLRPEHNDCVVIAEMVGGLGNPFIDPNGPPEERWKYFSDYNRRGIYLYTSADGYAWRRRKTATLPFRSGTQSCTFYDDQRARYVSFHRSGIFHTPALDTQRGSVVTEHDDLGQPCQFQPLSQQEYWKLRKTYPLRNPLPWYLDNGPLTPGGFGMEFGHVFDPVPDDPIGTDIYVTKAQKYGGAPDAYVAFPIVYFHYGPDGPPTRRALEEPSRQRGSGSLETQLAVSRDGLSWKRYPRPIYVGIGRHAGRNVVTAYLAHGMVFRGDEIWQYYFGEAQYHSAYHRDPGGPGVYRLVQRRDGFVSIDSPYEKEGRIVTKPFVFAGNRLKLNIDTGASGYAQVGFLDESGKPVAGLSVDDCIYINGNFVRSDVEWVDKGKELGSLAGQTVRLVIRMRGSKLYAMQFVDE